MASLFPPLNDYADANNESNTLDSLVQLTCTTARFMAELR